METFIEGLVIWADALGYWGVFWLMAVESSFIPFPSEVVVPPAAYLASQGQMDINMVVLAGVCGSLVGAAVNYFLALFLGRPLIYKLAEFKIMRLMMVNKKNLDKADKHFNEYGNISTFLGRLLPGIRQLISIPAGFARMHFAAFIFFTFLGSSIWIIILAALGYWFGAQQELITQYLLEFTLAFVVIVLVSIVIIALKVNKKRKAKNKL